MDFSILFTNTNYQQNNMLNMNMHSTSFKIIFNMNKW